MHSKTAHKWWSALATACILAVLCLLAAAAADDALYAFTHNGQDVVVLGQIDKMSGDTATVQVRELLRSSKSQRGASPLHSEQVAATITVKGLSAFAAGDRVLLSLQKKGGSYQVDMGAYRASSTELPLQITEPDGAASAQSACLTVFANSRGALCDFTLQDGSAFLEYRGQRYQVYSPAQGFLDPQVPGTPQLQPTYPAAGSNWFTRLQSPVLFGLLGLGALAVLFFFWQLRRRARRRTVRLKNGVHQHDD